MKKSKTEKTIDRLEETRRQNNVNWCDLIRLAAKYAPAKEFKSIMRGICNKDKEIMRVARELAR